MTDSGVEDPNGQMKPLPSCRPASEMFSAGGPLLFELYRLLNPQRSVLNQRRHHALCPDYDFGHRTDPGVCPDYGDVVYGAR